MVRSKIRGGLLYTVSYRRSVQVIFVTVARLPREEHLVSSSPLYEPGYFRYRLHVGSE